MQLDVSHVALEKLFHSLSDHRQSVSRDDFLAVRLLALRMCWTFQASMCLLQASLACTALLLLHWAGRARSA